VNPRMAPRRADRRLAALLVTAGAVFGGGLLLQQRAQPPAGEPPTATAEPSRPHEREVRRLFNAAVVMLHAKRHEEAIAALHSVLKYAPAMPEAHVNMGYALLGVQRPREAADFFSGAIALRADQANAYYGLALAQEARGDLELARGAMKTYLHLARDERPEHLARARAALWEWEQAPSPKAPVVPEPGKTFPPPATRSSPK
jgi:tetratricopeptide (TPR) repeat protein